MKKIVPLVITIALILSSCNITKDGKTQPADTQTSAPYLQSSIEESVEDEKVDMTQESTPGDEPASNNLKFDTPENHSIDSVVLDTLRDAVAEDTKIWSMIIVKDGAIIDEYYGIDERNGKEFSETSPFYLASCTKSFSGALIGIAIDEGLISGVDVKLSEYFPELATADDGREKITLKDLLTHTSGFEWDEWNSATMFHEMHQADNWVDFIFKQPMATAPGSTFNYNSGNSHLLTVILEQATGQPALDFAQKHLFGPLGVDSVNWPTDPQCVIDGSSGIEMTTRDAAKFGQLYLNGGKWNNQQVVSHAWVKQSTTVQSSGTGGRTGQYGYQWWIRPFGEENYDTFFAMGGGGHYIFVVPELELVVVMTCYNNGDSYAPWSYFTDYILPACE